MLTIASCEDITMEASSAWVSGPAPPAGLRSTLPPDSTITPALMRLTNWPRQSAQKPHNRHMTESWTPPKGIDPDRPSPARVYDCYLGGTHNFAADRAVAAPDSPALFGALEHYRRALAPGSYLVISHATAESEPVPTAKVSDLYTKVSQPLVPRSRSDLSHLLEGWELVEPGLSRGADWRPDPGDPPPGDVGKLATLAAVARKP